MADGDLGTEAVGDGEQIKTEVLTTLDMAPRECPESSSADHTEGRAKKTEMSLPHSRPVADRLGTRFVRMRKVASSLCGIAQPTQP